MHFTRMDQGSDEDFQILKRVHEKTLAELPDRLMAMVNDLSVDQAYNLNRRGHSLQAATRALRDGADEELIVAALVHDIGDELAPYNHAQIGAGILRPYVRAEVTWIVEQHGIFQSYYYAHHLGGDRNGRERFRDHPWYGACKYFCADWDQCSFDPNYPWEPLAAFEPLVRKIFTRPPHDPAT